MNARSRPRRTLGACTLLLALPLAAASLELHAADRPWKSQAKVPAGAPLNAGTTPADAAALLEPPAKVRLNHMRSTWSKVLKDFAKATRKELVADVVPEGHFSRWDRKDHAPEDALRILNAALEEMGFRLQEKGKFLVLVELKHSRRNYRPAVVPLEDVPAEDEAEPAVAKAVPASAEKRTVKKPPAQPAKSQASRSARDDRARARASIQRVSGEQESPPPLKRAARPEAAEPEAATAAEPTLTKVRLKARDAVTVARIIHNAFKGHADLVDEGPAGLQGFRVFRVELDKNGKPLPRAPNAAPRFTIGIDIDNNQLVVEAVPQETPSVLRLIRTLDKLPSETQRTVKAVTTNKDAGQLASSLQPELNRLADAQKKAARRSGARLARGRVEADEADDAEEAEEEQPDLRDFGQRRMRAEEAEEPEEPEEMEQPEGGSALLGSIKGEVSVEAVPELGILIIKGNEKDVAAVMDVIREIEKLSIGAAPEVELVLLQHVNSEALASLLASVYERLSPSRRTPGQGQQQQQNVLVIPVVRPNAILIVASRADIDSARELAEQLDQPIDPRTEYKVFRLKYAIPSQVVDAVEAVYPAGEGQQQPGQAAPTTSTQGLAPRVRITPDPRTNSVVVVARPRDMREVALLIHELDSPDSASVAQLEIFVLKYAVADELATTLQLAFQSLLNPARITSQQQGGGQQFQQQFQGQGQQTGATELREVKSQILQFLDREGGRQQMLQSGILSDIRISSDVRTNSVVVTAPEASMDLIAQLIKQFDQPTAFNAVIKVIPMTNGDAQSTVTLLNNLFGARPAGQQGQQQGGQAGQNVPGLVAAGADDPSSLLVPLRFSVDVRTNSVIATGGADAITVVETIILRLDESEIRQRKNKVYRLKNSPAIDVANAISQFLQTQRQVEQADPGLVSPFEQIEREVIVVPEPVSNSLLVSATPRYFDDIIQLIDEIDAEPKQVLIQALMVEVLLDNADEWGVELGLQDSILFDRSVLTDVQFINETFVNPSGNQVSNQKIITQAGVPGFPFNNAALGNNVTPSLDPSRIGGQALSNFNMNRVNAELGFGGLVLAAGSESVSALLRAVAARRRVDVLSRPQIRTLDNQLANIQVGQEIPRVGNFSINQTTGLATPVVEQRLVGLILQVRPRITPENTVVMEVVARKDALSQQSVPLFLNPNGSSITSPIIDTTAALTIVSVKNGQTVILGGIITKRDENTERKVPLLGDIPLIGQAFRYDFKRSQRTELLVFLTPRVVTSDAEAEMIKEIETQRLNFIEAEAEMIHGPLFGIPAETGWHGTGTPPPAPDPMEGLRAPPASPPRAIPMSLERLDDPETPTTEMPGELQQIPPFPEEDLNVDLSKKGRRAQRDSALQPAGFEQAGRTTLTRKKESRYMPPGKAKRPFLPGPGGARN